MNTNPVALHALACACMASLLAAAPTPARAQQHDAAQAVVAQTVFVTATRGALPQADAPAATSVVRQRELEDRGADNVVDGLRGEAGVSAIGRPLGGRRVLSLRGMESRHTLMLIDGQRIAPSDGVIGNSDFQLDWISIGDLDRIEVVRGPMSVLYGSEALGGVVNLVTRRPGDALAGSARVEGLRAQGDRGGDGHRATARVNVPLGSAWALAVGASDLRRQAVASKADPRIDELEGRHRTDGSAQLLLRAAPGHDVLLEHRAGQEDRWGGARERGGARRHHLSLHDIERRHTALTWDGDWPARAITTQLRAYSSTLDHHNARTEGVTPLRPNRVDETVIDGHAAGTAGAHRVTGGFEWRDEALRNDALAGGEGSVDHRAVYAQDEWALGALALTLGARHDRHEVFGGRTSPRAYGVWKLGHGWIAKGGIGWGYKAPTLKQVSAGYVEDEGPFSYAANPALQPEINRAVEAGFAWQGGAGFGAQVMAFHNRVRNLMVPVLVASTPRPLYEWRNVDVAILKGVETSLDWRVLRGVSAKLNHQWLDARNDAGDRLDRRPRHIVGAALEWVHAGASTRQAGAALSPVPSSVPQRVGLRADHQRGLLLASTTPGAPPQAVPAFTLLSAYSAWSLSRAIELGAGIDNLGNLELLEKSPLYMQGIAPRTFRLSLNARW